MSVKKIGLIINTIHFSDAYLFGVV
jgi:hypothetical protein